MIIALAGRRIDSPDAEVRRFPLENVELVREKLDAFFEANKPEMLICSGACGSDLLALEVAGENKVLRTMVLPFAYELFKKYSVIDRPGKWGEIFDKIYNELKESNNVIVLHYSVDDPKAYEKTNIEILKLAEQLSQPSHEKPKEVYVLALWEGKSRGDDDTTAHFLKEAKKRSIRTAEINTLVNSH